MSEAERKSVLDLFPYFNQKYPVIFDVGSNKGEWTDLLIDQAAEVHLFEPNELLLHYTMVKYADRRNVHYHNYVISDQDFIEIDFNVFDYQYNGLSSIYTNPKWSDLPHETITVEQQTLDGIHRGWVRKPIDFLKIDVEGAEMKVLNGANWILKNKLVKFIQIEKSEHLHLAGYTFDDVIDHLASFGYKPIPTTDTENVIFAMEEFTQLWNSEFKKSTEGMKFNFVLEIGCFEGLTTHYICHNLLNPGGRVICVDPLEDRYLTENLNQYATDLNADCGDMFVGQYDRFIRNTKGLPVELLRMKSSDLLKVEGFHHYRFDLIYIDGDHRADAVYADAKLAFQHCKIGGHILFDDYEWKPEVEESTMKGINRFIDEMPTRKMIVVKRGYQILCKKLENL